MKQIQKKQRQTFMIEEDNNSGGSWIDVNLLPRCKFITWTMELDGMVHRQFLISAYSFKDARRLLLSLHKQAGILYYCDCCGPGFSDKIKNLSTGETRGFYISLDEFEENIELYIGQQRR